MPTPPTYTSPGTPGGHGSSAASSTRAVVFGIGSPIGTAFASAAKPRGRCCHTAKIADSVIP